MSDSVKYLLDEQHLPRTWYNINADLPTPLDPVLHPGTQQPITADDLAVIFPRAVIEQEMSSEREIEIPRAGTRGLSAVAPRATLPGTSTGESAQDAGEDLLQVRGREPGRQS